VEIHSGGTLRRQIAVVAKYPFYVNDIRESLLELDVEMYSSTDILEIQEQIDAGNEFDCIFFPHHSKIIPSAFLQRNSCIGFHTGDLPSDRGGSPIQHKILRGEYLTFVNALKLTPEIDAGDLIYRESVSLENGSIETILKNISKIIAGMIKVILVENPTPTPQLGSESTYSRLKPQDSCLDLGLLGIREIYDRIRMLDGLDYPPANLKIGPHTLHLRDARLQDGKLTFISQIEEIQ
jgi:methionyl-tRNA formyltransferase